MSRTMLFRRLIALERASTPVDPQSLCMDLVFEDPELQRRYPIQGRKDKIEIVFVKPAEVQYGP